MYKKIKLPISLSDVERWRANRSCNNELFFASTTAEIIKKIRQLFFKLIISQEKLIHVLYVKSIHE